MKLIENKKVLIKGKEASYFETIKFCNEVVPEKGWTSKSMKQSIKIDALLENNLDQVDIEDADMDYVKSIVSVMPWATKDIEIVNFCEYIKSIK